MSLVCSYMVGFLRFGHIIIMMHTDKVYDMQLTTPLLAMYVYGILIKLT